MNLNKARVADVTAKTQSDILQDSLVKTDFEFLDDEVVTDVIQQQQQQQKILQQINAACCSVSQF